jgi:hypothetical protein
MVDAHGTAGAKQTAPRLQMPCDVEFGLMLSLADSAPTKANKWTHWNLNPGRSACEAEVMPLNHVLAYL